MFSHETLSKDIKGNEGISIKNKINHNELLLDNTASNNETSNEIDYLNSKSSNEKKIRGFWTKEEDYILFKSYVEKPKDWQFISKFLIHKTEKQIKSHFFNLILKNIEKERKENNNQCKFSNNFKQYYVTKNK